MPRRVVAALILLTFTLASCRTWTPVQGIPDPVPQSVRVELVSGDRVEVSEARIDADTLTGRIVGGTDQVRIPADQIASVEAGRLSWARTALVVLGVGALSFGILLAISLQNYNPLGT